MTDPFDRASGRPAPAATRWLEAAGAVLVAASVALAAYAAHGVGGEVQARLQLAALFGFGHGLALVALAPAALRRLRCAALFGLLAGALLFAGSLAGAHFLGTPTTLAPVGGSLLILAWLLYAADALRR